MDQRLTMRVYLLDVVTVKPGFAGAFRATYRDDYVPGAERRGMALAGAWQSPPADMVELATTLYYLWAVEGVEGWWRARLSRTLDGADERSAKHAFWLRCEPMVASRERRMLAAQPEA